MCVAGKFVIVFCDSWLTSAKVILLACFLISVRPRRSFIFRYLEGKRRMLLPQIWTGHVAFLDPIVNFSSKSVVPSSTSLLPLSIQWGRQWFDLFYWRWFLPLIKFPFNFFLQVVADLTRKRKNNAEVKNDKSLSHCKKIEQLNIKVVEIWDENPLVLNYGSELLCCCLFPKSPCHLNFHGNCRRGSPECTLQPPVGLPSSLSPG